MTRVQFVKRSGNKKIGLIPSTTSEMSTCPSTCAFHNKGCYAGFHNLINNWRKVSEGKRGSDWDNLCNEIRKLPDNQIWRHNVAGDLPGKDGKIDTKELAKLVRANKGKRGFTFTHKPVSFSGQGIINARAIHAANKQGFTINLSTESIEQADQYLKLGIGPVALVVPSDIKYKSFKTPAGNQVVICPAVTHKDKIKCKNCGLCAIPNRKSIIAFPAHGPSKKKVSGLVRLRRK